MPATWEELVQSLDTWSNAREFDGGLEVTFDSGGARRTVQLVMTPGDWEELAWVIQGETPESVRRRLLDLEEDEQFLVCDSGVDLVASRTRELPPDPDLLRMQELAAQHPDGVIPGGYWSPHPPDDPSG